MTEETEEYFLSFIIETIAGILKALGMDETAAKKTSAWLVYGTLALIILYVGYRVSRFKK